jgi:hypothetical protein
MDPSRIPFYGRERVVTAIVQGVLGPKPLSFSLVGPKLVGKSHLLRYLAGPEGPLLSDELASARPRTFRDGGQVLALWIDCDWQEAQVDLTGWIYQRLVEYIREQVKIPLNWARVEGQSSASLRIYQMVRELNERDFRLVLLLDNFDRVFENQLITTATVDELRPLTLEAALLVATEQPLHDLDRELAASPLFNVMTQLFMGLLDPKVANAWIASYADDFPAVAQMVDELVRLTGMHPFLVRRLGDILVEVQQMLPGTDLAADTHLPLLRLRLAEHGRLLFETNWKRLQNPPERLHKPMVMQLIQRMASGLLPLDEVAMEQGGVLNWLINQAMVTLSAGADASGYRLFTPLFAEFVTRRLIREPENGAAAPANGQIATPASIAVPPQAADLDQFTKIEAALLRYFQVHQNQTIPAEQLLTDVWKRPTSTNRRVQEAIRRLRLQLETMNPPIGSIENDRGRGYRFIPASSKR